MKERAQKTACAARRLIKSEARRYVYQALSDHIGGGAYNPMVALEDAIIEEASLMWREAYALWAAEDDPLPTLLPIIEKVAVESYHDCQHSFEEANARQVAQVKLKEFFKKFNPQGMFR